MRTNKIIYLFFILTMSCAPKDKCKYIPIKWKEISNSQKTKWLKDSKNICNLNKFEPAIPFLIDLIKVYSLKDRDINNYNSRLMKRIILNQFRDIHINIEYYILMQDDIKQINIECNYKYSNLDLYFILRVLFNHDENLLFEIENMIFN